MCHIIGNITFQLVNYTKTPVGTCRKQFLTVGNALLINVVCNNTKISLIELSNRLETGGNTLNVNVPYNWIKLTLFNMLITLIILFGHVEHNF